MIKIPTYLDNINDWRDIVKGKSIILDSDTIIALLLICIWVHPFLSYHPQIQPIYSQVIQLISPYRYSKEMLTSYSKIGLHTKS